MKLNLGCGENVPSGWVNVDYSLGARLTKIPFFGAVNRKIKLFNIDWDERIVLHDLRRPFPWAEASADVVYSSHTLEHLRKEEGRAFLAECHRVLRPAGIIRIVVPDLEALVRAYTEGRTPADDFVSGLGVLYDTSMNPLKTRLYPLIQFPHKCMYDTRRLLQILSELGFEAAPREAFDSDIDDIEQIEIASRTEGAVIVEGRKRQLIELESRTS